MGLFFNITITIIMTILLLGSIGEKDKDKQARYFTGFMVVVIMFASMNYFALNVVVK